MNQRVIRAPTLKEWNLHVNDIIKQYESEGVCFGSVEDFLREHTNCPDCSEKLIRFDSNRSRHFVGGIVFCPNQLNSETHSRGYWVEVWPHEPFIDRTKNLLSLTSEQLDSLPKIRQEDQEENVKRLFRYSNPAIKNCYRPLKVWHHERVIGIRKEEGLPHSQDRLPTPTYVHE